METDIHEKAWARQVVWIKERIAEGKKFPEPELEWWLDILRILAIRHSHKLASHDGFDSHFRDELRRLNAGIVV